MRHALILLCLTGCSQRPLYLPDVEAPTPRVDGGARDLASADLTCARTRCGDECVDLESSSAHCGACGHDCGGDPCSGGKCAAVTVIDPLHGAFALAIDERDVFLSTSDIVRVSVSTGAATVLATGVAESGGLAIDATHVYWSNFNEGAIRKVPIAGGAPITLASGQHNPDAVAVDAANVYWINAADAAIVKLPLAGGAPVQLALVPQANAPGSIASDGTSVFWLLDGSYLHRVPVGGGPYARVVDLYLNSSRFVLRDGWIYFSNTAEATPGGVDKVRSDGSGQQALSRRDPTAPAGIASDGQFVYYTTFGAFDGTVRRVSVGGGAQEVLVANQRHAGPIVVNSKFVYWIEEGGGQPGTLRRMAK